MSTAGLPDTSDIVTAEAVAVAEKSPAAPTGGLGFVAFASIIFALLALIGSVSAISTWFYGYGRIAGMMLPSGPSAANVPQEMIDLQEDFILRITSVYQRFAVINLPLAFLHLLVDLTMIAGGIGVLMKRNTAAKLLVVALIVALGLDLAGLFASLLSQLEINQIIQDFLAQMTSQTLKKMPNSAKAMFKWYMSFMSSAPITSFFGIFGWVAVKASFYLYGAARLKKKELRLAFK
jgi:hypothetical protein